MFILFAILAVCAIVAVPVIELIGTQNGKNRVKVDGRHVLLDDAELEALTSGKPLDEIQSAKDASALEAKTLTATADALKIAEADLAEAVRNLDVVKKKLANAEAAAEKSEGLRAIADAEVERLSAELLATQKKLEAAEKPKAPAKSK